MKTLQDDEPFEQWGYLSAAYEGSPWPEAWRVCRDEKFARNLQKIYNGGQIAHRTVSQWEIIDVSD